MQQAVKKPTRRGSYVLGFKSGTLYCGVLPPEVKHRADLPPPVDVETLRREAKAGRELMKELLC